MPDPWDTQLEALGAFIRTQRKLANLSLRQLADMTSLSNPYHRRMGAEPGVSCLTAAISGAVTASAALSEIMRRSHPLTEVAFPQERM